MVGRYVLSEKYYGFYLFCSGKETVGCWTLGRDLHHGYVGGFWPIEGKATVTGSPNIGNTLWANFSDSSDPKVPTGSVKYTWQRSVSGANSVKTK